MRDARRSRPPKTHRTLTALIVAGACLLGRAGSASAQSSQSPSGIEIGGGYLNIMGTMQGANLQVAVPFGDSWSVIGELNIASGRDCRGCDPRFSDVSGLAGVRASWLGRRRITPFVQILAGGLHSKAEPYSWAVTFANDVRVGESAAGFTVNYLAFQPGAGITIRLTPRVGLRLQTDVQVAIPDQQEYEGLSVFPRTLVGAVVRLGR
jgi:opacity protein-like surface antigen